MYEKIDLFWVQDSAGVHTCHVNGESLSFEQSLIGTLHLRNDSWRVVLKDGTDITPEEGCMTYSRARNLMESHYRKQHPEKTEKVEVPVASTKTATIRTPRSAQPGKI